MNTSAQEQNSTKDSTTIDTAFASLGSLVGEEKVEELRELVASSAENAESKIMQFIKDLTGNLPQDFALPSLATVKKHPVATVGTLAAGVGSIFLLREYLKRSKSATASKTAATDKQPKAVSAKGKGRNKLEASSGQTTKAKKTSAAKAAKGTAAKTVAKGKKR